MDGCLQRRNRKILIIRGHETIMISNCNDKDANISMDLYFENKPPIENICVNVGAKRVRY